MLEVGFEIDFRSDLKDSILDQVLVDREAELSFDVGDGVKVFLELQTRAVSGRWLSSSREPSNSDLFASKIEIPRFENVYAMSRMESASSMPSYCEAFLCSCSRV